MDLDVAFFDHQAGPDEVEQLVFRDHALAPLDQGQQQVEGAAAQLGRLPVVLTPNSDPGRPFGNVDDNLETVSGADAVYSNRLFVGGTFYGDMYEMLSVSLSGGLQARGQLLFSADTDNALPGSITPSVPEPETYALMLAGLGIIGYAARRRRA